MARKRKRAGTPLREPQKDGQEERAAGTPAEYYDLKTGAVRDLAEADEENAPEVSEEELARYRSGPKWKIPERARLLFIKFWFAGAVCFFFIWGLSAYLASYLDVLFVTAFALGVVTDLLTNNALRFFERTPGANAGYMMVRRRGVGGLFLNIIYAFCIVFLVYCMYAGINGIAGLVTGTSNRIFLGVEPILFGLFCLGADLLLIRARDLLEGSLRKSGKSC